jgi:hypothetical protein
MNPWTLSCLSGKDFGFRRSPDALAAKSLFAHARFASALYVKLRNGARLPATATRPGFGRQRGLLTYLREALVQPTWAKRGNLDGPAEILLSIRLDRKQKRLGIQAGLAILRFRKIQRRLKEDGKREAPHSAVQLRGPW